jgi:hypothetical protein
MSEHRLALTKINTDENVTQRLYFYAINTDDEENSSVTYAYMIV